MFISKLDFYLSTFTVNNYIQQILFANQNVAEMETQLIYIQILTTHQYTMPFFPFFKSGKQYERVTSQNNENFQSRQYFFPLFSKWILSAQINASVFSSNVHFFLSKWCSHMWPIFPQIFSLGRKFSSAAHYWAIMIKRGFRTNDKVTFPWLKWLW